MYSDLDKLRMSELVEVHGPEGAVRLLKMSIRDQSDELSDLGLKEPARDAAEWADLLSDLLLK